MKEKILNFINKGISINVLKSIAVIAMLIDHIGYYFESYIPNTLYITLRIIGRIAMPLFVYILVQGFFHTKNIKKYLMRIFILALITQVALTVVGIININMVKEYSIAIYKKGNILFSFGFGLILLNMLQNKIMIKKLDYNKNMLIKILYIVMLIGIYLFVPIDYNFEALLLTLFFYYIEKLKITYYLSRQKASFNMKKIIASSINEKRMQVIYILSIALAMLITIIYLKSNYYELLALPFIYLYNGEKKNQKYITSSFFYMFFPIHHIILYTLGLLISILK